MHLAVTGCCRHCINLSPQKNCLLPGMRNEIAALIEISLRSMFYSDVGAHPNCIVLILSNPSFHVLKSCLVVDSAALLMNI